MQDPTQVMAEEVEVESNGTANYSSLAARARERRQQIERNHSTDLEPPGFQGIVAVRYRVLSFQEIRAISKRHERISDESTQELYIAADSLIKASVNSLEITEGGERNELGFGWSLQLVRALGVDVDDTWTPRQALFACFPRDMLVIAHYGEYSLWLQAAEEDVDREQDEDFPQSR